MALFTKAFWIKTLEAVLVTFASTFAASLLLTTTPTVKGVLAALISGGVAALYVLAKQIGTVQSTNLAARAKHATNQF